MRQPFNLNSLGLTAAEAALQDTVFVKKSKKLNQEGLKQWKNALHTLEIPFWESQGNFLLVDVQKGLMKTGMEVYQASLKQGVIFRPVVNYGLPGALRITVGTETENRRAITLMKKLKENRRKG